jgi:hypothetical protein
MLLERLMLLAEERRDMLAGEERGKGRGSVEEVTGEVVPAQAATKQG